jgi:hypothetical protein
MVSRLELVGLGTSQWDLMHCVMKAGISSDKKRRRLSWLRRILNSYGTSVLYYSSASKTRSDPKHYSSDPYVGSCAQEQIISHHLRVET